MIARDGPYFKSYKSIMQSKKQNLFCGYHQVLNVVNIKTVEVAFHFFLHLQIMFFTLLASLYDKMKAFTRILNGEERRFKTLQVRNQTGPLVVQTSYNTGNTWLRQIGLSI